VTGVTDGAPTRRHLLVAGTAALTGLAACSSGTSGTSTASATGPKASTTGTTTSASGAQAGTATSSGAASAASSGAPSASASPAAGPDITRATSGRPEVALTFHGAGDVTILRRMLAEFKDAGAHITVLGIGQWLAAEPVVAKLVLDGGHDLGNHTWSHQTMPRLSASRMTTEVGRAADELRKLTGTPGRWFRPSGTPHSTPAIRAAAVAAGYGACLAYDVDPLDYTDPGPAAIVKAFRAKVRAGSVVSLHLGHPGTLTAMPQLLSTLHDRGLTAVTATHLLGSS
jgi:peptidoglycan/xylan/chitin deacetylase (PgdA/CDA1 family)